MKIKRIVQVALALSLTLFLAMAGCGGGARTGAPVGTSEAKEMLTFGSREIASFIGSMQAVAGRGDIATMTPKVEDLCRKYEVFWPGMMQGTVTAAQWEKVAEKSASLKTVIYGTLYGLFSRETVATGGTLRKVGDISRNLSGAASSLYSAADNMYSLRNLYSLLAKHTTGDGTKVKASDPPPKSTVELGAFGGVFVGLDWDRATGDLKLTRYPADPQFGAPGQPVTVRELEQYFIDTAKQRLSTARAQIAGREQSSSPPVPGM